MYAAFALLALVNIIAVLYQEHENAENYITLLNNTTGGDSYCFLDVSYPDSPKPLVVVVNGGNYPLRDVAARLVDQEKYNRLVGKSPVTMDNVFSADTIYHVGELNTKGSKMLGAFDLTSEPGDARNFNIFFSGLNGFWVETLRLRRVNGQWKQAVRVIRNEVHASKSETVELYQHVDPEYPLTDGKVVWE